jgi:hypothetical protein
MRGVARLERDRQHVLIRADEPVGGPLEQDAAAKGRRRLTGRGGDEPVEMEAREVQARREGFARRFVVVQ